jgi:hypothetical protein
MEGRTLCYGGHTICYTGLTICFFMNYKVEWEYSSLCNHDNTRNVLKNTFQSHCPLESAHNHCAPQCFSTGVREIGSPSFGPEGRWRTIRFQGGTGGLVEVTYDKQNLSQHVAKKLMHLPPRVDVLLEEYTKNMSHIQECTFWLSKSARPLKSNGVC